MMPLTSQPSSWNMFCPFQTGPPACERVPASFVSMFVEEDAAQDGVGDVAVGGEADAALRCLRRRWVLLDLDCT